MLPPPLTMQSPFPTPVPPAYDSSAPLSQWMISQSFDRAEDCEKAEQMDLDKALKRKASCRSHGAVGVGAVHRDRRSSPQGKIGLASDNDAIYYWSSIACRVVKPNYIANRSCSTHRTRGSDADNQEMPRGRISTQPSVRRRASGPASKRQPSPP
jgi:hypothetical protein